MGEFNRRGFDISSKSRLFLSLHLTDECVLSTLPCCVERSLVGSKRLLSKDLDTENQLVTALTWINDNKYRKQNFQQRIYAIVDNLGVVGDEKVLLRFAFTTEIARFGRMY